MLRDALLENLHRVALNPLEEAAAYQQMIEEFGLTQVQLSKSVSKSRPQIANTLRLLNLPASVQKRVAAGVLSLSLIHILYTSRLNSVRRSNIVTSMVDTSSTGLKCSCTKPIVLISWPRPSNA